MPEWSTACPGWAQRLREGRSIIPPPIFPEQAEAALRVLRELRIVDAPGSPTFVDACAPWVFDLAASIFGAYDAETGRRLITEWFVLIPKKNSKSTLAAAIMLTALILNWRQSATFSILAPTVKVADNSFDPAQDMCKIDDELADLMHTQKHIRTITHRTSDAALRVLAADSNTVGGTKDVGVLVDELWLFGKMAGAANMLREATGGLVSRPEGFVIYLTTQSDEPPAGVFKQKLDYARAVRDGRIVDPKFVPVIYEFPREMIDAGEHREPRNFPLVNPNWGRSVDAEYIEREFSKAVEVGEDETRGFLSKHLNVEIGLALGTDRWAGADHWQRQARVGELALEQLLARSEVIVAGVDGGGLDDLLGLCVMGRDAETGRWLAWARAWAHPSVLERHKQLAPRFRDFARDGDLVLVQQIGEDVEELAALVAQCWASGLMPEKGCIGVDQHGIGAVLDALVALDVPSEAVVGISQGWRLTGAIKTTERQLASGGMEHSGAPLMAWCVGNARIEPRGNAVMITKQGSGAAKIDPLMALFDAAALLALSPAGVGRSWWDAPNAVAG